MSKLKCAIVCGGTYGLGFEITKYFVEKKIKVIVLGRGKKKLDEIKRTFNKNLVETYKCDLSKIGEVNSIFTKIKKKKNIINYLICNAGNGKNTFVLKKTYQDYINAFNQNLITAVNPIEVLIYKKNFKDLKIINIASIAGDFKGSAPLPYSLAKNSLINYTKEISKVFAKKKILINSISPGHIFQKNNNWYKKYKSNKAKIKKFIDNNVSLKRFCVPGDIINVIDFLLSKKSDYITGIDIKVDGKSN